VGLGKIKHVVVLMMENRSQDNLLGWLYQAEKNRPPRNIPPQIPPSYDGLVPGKYSNTYNGKTVQAGGNPTNFLSPSPDPQEEFDHMTDQIFGNPHQASPDMSGFLADYATTDAGKSGTEGQILQTYGPTWAKVINNLAKSFAVSDRWFASAPCQTWPNRGFMHAGSSDGHINNDLYEPYDIPTIFNVLEDQKKTWGVFYPEYYTELGIAYPSLTFGQFLPQLFWYEMSRFFYMDQFFQRCKAPAGAPPDQKLPQYSFVEPQFQEKGENDYHPPSNVLFAEQFLKSVYDAVLNSPYRDDILLVVTFDEHGGCYDHVPPQPSSIPPVPGSKSRDGSFDFTRYGVRVPTIVISSYVQPGTVFRAPANPKVPNPPQYDHTSILATLRDWLQLNPRDPFFQNPRVRQAPTLAQVLDLDSPRLNWPEISGPEAPEAAPDMPPAPPSDMQKGLKEFAVRMDRQHRSKKKLTHEDAKNFMRALPPGEP